MNPKVEKLLKLPLYQRLIILAVLVILVIGGFVWLMYLPEYDKLDGLDKQLAKLESELVQKRQIASNLPKFKAEFAKMEKQLEQALTQLPNKSEVPSVLTNLSTLAKDSGLDVKKFQPKGEVPKGFYAEVPFSLLLEGTYHQFALFAQSVGELSRIVNLSDLKMSGPKIDGNSVTLKIDCKVTTFRFIEK